MLSRRFRTRVLPLLATAALMVAPATLAGCSSEAAAPPPAPTESVEPLAAPARVDVEEWMQAALSPGTTIIDVRTPEEFNAGHVAGAINIPVEFADFPAQVAALDPTATYAVYCRTGSRSAAATLQMAALGYTSIFDLEGGFADLEAAGMPTA